jgi:hypothetical protein
MSKYASLDKDALVAEIKTRRQAGSKISVDLRAADDKLRAALELDDVSGGSSSAPVQKAAKLDKTTSLESQIQLDPIAPEAPTQPTEDEFAKGFIALNNKDGLRYQVIKTEDELKPYKARIPKQASGHPGLFWEGSGEEFKDTFVKE